jgi:hypothetical protein
MTLRAMGPYNGVLPEPTGMAIGYVRDPKRAPHLLYTQLVPAPEVLFRWFNFDPDEPVRVVNTDEQAWPYGSYRPTGKANQMRGEWLSESIQRWDFAYTLDDQTQRAWAKQGLNPKQFFDLTTMSKAMVHRSARIVAKLLGASWGNNTATVQALLGLPAPIYWDQSSGTELDPVTSMPNPAFQVIKKTLDRVRRRIDLLTNGAIGDNEFNIVIPPKVANAVAECGEIVNAVKQSQYANQLIDWRNRKWNLPDSYAGFNWVVEDTPRVYTRQNADGTTASTTNGDKDYILSTDTCYVVSRPGGIDGGYGFPSYSTLQLYTLNGEAQIQAFSEPKHELLEGHVVLEDKPVVASTLSGFKLTSVLSPTFV